MSKNRVFDEPGRKKQSIIPNSIFIKQTNWRKTLFKMFEQNIEIIKLKSEDITSLTQDEVEEILRVQVAFLMSSFDYLIHESIKYKMIDMFNLTEEKTDAFKKFKVSMYTLEKAIINPTSENWLRNEIEFSHGRESFLNPKRLLEILDNYGKKGIIDNYCIAKSTSLEEFNTKLRVINEKRNLIVHQMDIQNKRTGKRHSIVKEDVDSWICFILEFGCYIINEI